MNVINVEIISAEQVVFSGQANFVSLPGESGELGILPGHTPLISTVKTGTVYIDKGNNEHEYVFVAGGLIDVHPNKVVVLVDTAIRGDDLDEARAEQARTRAQETIEGKNTNFDLAVAKAELAISTAQLAAIARLRKNRY
jgi:F-type H+-transporting ATPase subunit epsilon